MADQQNQFDSPPPTTTQPPATSAVPPPPPNTEDMIGCVMALEAALLPCLPARELQAIDRSPHPSHQIDVERHARDFMEAAKKLHLYFVGLQREDQPTKAERLKKEIADMEEELKIKKELMQKHEKLIHGWRREIKLKRSIGQTQNRAGEGLDITYYMLVPLKTLQLYLCLQRTHKLHI